MSRGRLTLGLTMLALTLAPAGAHAAVWELKTAVLPAGGTEGELLGVSCASASVCTAVGDYFNGSIVGAMGNEWNGTSWAVASVEANPGEKNGKLYGVLCYSSTRCMAVGSYGTKGGGGNSLVEASNKGAWTHVTSPNHGGGKFDKLYDVWCKSLEYCVATGDYLNTEAGEKGAVLAEEWEGTTWNLMSPIENPGKNKNGKLWSIACSAEASCRAVGNWGTEAGIGVAGEETLSGTKWSATQLPEPPVADFAELYGISCTSEKSCMAVGVWRETESETKKLTILTELWNGKAWSYSIPPRPIGATESEFRSVSCPAVEECIAVGHYRDSSKKELTLAEVWNGKEWKIQTSPNPSGALASALQGVSCTEIEVCNAVGDYLNSENKLKPLAAHL